jgi:hypothetical protein
LLKNTIERLAIGLERLGESQVMQKNYAEMLRERIDENTIFIALLSVDRDDSVLFAKLFHISQRIYPPKTSKRNGYFAHYALADAIATVLRKTLVGIRRLISFPARCAQLRFMGFA